MIIGVPKEIKIRENRVGIVPGGVKYLKNLGHDVFIEKAAGEGAGITDGLYQEAGATMIATADELWQKADLIMKVKEPQPAEFERMRPGLILYTYLHLAAEPKLAEALLAHKVTGIAYDTVELPDGSLPLLKPMSEVAGRMAVQIGAHCLEKHHGGKGLLLGGVPGVRKGRVTILGAGNAGLNAAKMAVGFGAEVTILDINQNRLAYLDDIFGNSLTTLMSNPENIAHSVRNADLLISTVLVTGAKAPRLVTKDLIRSMEKGSVVVDVSIDQGGSIETIKPTNHDDPVYQWEGINHYGVTNMPGAVPKTSTYALTNVTLKYVGEIASLGLQKALQSSSALRSGVNTFDGKITHKVVANALGYKHSPLDP